MILATYFFEWEIKSFVETKAKRGLSLETAEELQAAVTGGLVDFYGEDENPNKVYFYFDELSNSLTINKNNSATTGNRVWQISFSLRVYYDKSVSEAVSARVKMYLKRYESSLWCIARNVEPTLSVLGVSYQKLPR